MIKNEEIGLLEEVLQLVEAAEKLIGTAAPLEFIDRWVELMSEIFGDHFFLIRFFHQDQVYSRMMVGQRRYVDHHLTLSGSEIKALDDAVDGQAIEVELPEYTGSAAFFACYSTEDELIGLVLVEPKEEATLRKMAFLMRFVRPLLQRVVSTSALMSFQKRMHTLCARLAHGLKTPLTVIRGNSDLLPKNQDKVAVTINEEVRNMTELIDGSLQMITLLSQQERLSKDRVKMADLAAEWRTRLEQLDPEGRVEVMAGANGRVLEIDKIRLTEAVFNLVNNALKYTDGEIEVKIRRQVPWDLITISDKGEGLAPEVLARLGTEFYRASDRPGMGLGIHITQAIVEAHGGVFTVTSLLGEGSEFTIKVPMAR